MNVKITPMSSHPTSSRRARGPASPERQLQRQAERRARLIAAAIEVYGENGYRHSGVKQVCEKAGLTQRYFYESFSHSDELLVACYDLITQALLDDIDRAAQAAGSDSTARGKAMLLAYFHALKDQPKAANVFLVDIRGISPTVDQAIERTLKAFAQHVARTVLQPDNLPDEMLQAGVQGGIIHIALHWIANGYTPSVEAVADIALKLSSVLLTDTPAG